ncbi:MAG TPA: M67 family metallopeptidase [Phototrophicaceae bacterium]|nr:M67 family metallopeptidase [Phototrophicaceae bacterium]
MPLYLSQNQAQLIVQQARTDQPQETCGILLGVSETVHEIISVPNIAADPLHFYRLEDAALAHALLQAETKGLSLVGFYHSHPNGDPIPSPTDVQQAYYPDAAYLIVGLRHAEPRLAAWKIHKGTVTPVDMVIGTLPNTSDQRDASLSQAQKVAILLAALVAFAFMIILSLSLLPPAPVIPLP